MAQKWREGEQVAGGGNAWEKNAPIAYPSVLDPTYSIISKLYPQQPVMGSLGGMPPVGVAPQAPFYPSLVSPSLAELAKVYRRQMSGPEFRSVPDGFRPVSIEPKIVSGLSGVWEVGTRQGLGRIRKALGGLVEILGDMTSNQDWTRRGRTDAADARRYMNEVQLQRPQIEGFGPNSIVNDVPGFIAEGIASITEDLLASVLGGRVGTIKEFGGNYSDGKADGLPPISAGTRAGLKTFAGKAGDKMGETIFSNKVVARAGRNVANRLDIDPKMRERIGRIYSPLPGEIITDTVESGIDMVPGLKPEKKDDESGKDEESGSIVGTAATSLLKNTAEEVGNAARQKALDSIRKRTRTGKR